MERKVEEENPRFFIAVHVGAGFHFPSNEKALKSAMNCACLAAASVLRKGPQPGGCLDARFSRHSSLRASKEFGNKWRKKTKRMVIPPIAQDDPCTNAGRGSNLTEEGHVECDASVMDGDTGAFGAVAAVPDQVCEMLSTLLLA